ncbi:ABC transporter ATP-binding protein [Enterococcus ureasiticus]|nr:ABC transporter ATP-binding protein [Enterococcus ureasiticus]
MLQRLGISLVYQLREKVISQILNLKKEEIDNFSSGNLASMLTNDTSALFHIISTTFPSFIISLISVIFMSITLFYLSLQLSIVLLILIPILWIIYFPLGKTLAKISFEIQNNIGKLTDFGHFISNKNEFIKVNLTRDFEYKKGMNLIKFLKNISKRQAKIFAIVTPFVSMLLIFSVLSVISYGLYLVKLDSLSIGSLIAYLTLFFQLINPLSELGTSISHFKGIEGASRRIEELLSNDNVECNKNNELDFKFNGIEFKNVSFSYKTSSMNVVVDPILKEINFTGNKGQLIAFVGPSGSGKTTLFSLIERLYTKFDGTIKIGNSSITEIPLNVLRSHIKYVIQDYPVFSATIRENLVYGLKNSFTDDELLRASELSNFRTVIDNLPNGLDTIILEDGISLSEGQKQRLAITRCFIADSSVLLLDEVTSALDAVSEKIVQNSINFLVKEQSKLILVNAHRLSTIRQADQIIFLDKGIITGKGTHEKLLNEHDMYRKFIATQF